MQLEAQTKQSEAQTKWLAIASRLSFVRPAFLTYHDKIALEGAVESIAERSRLLLDALRDDSSPPSIGPESESGLYFSLRAAFSGMDSLVRESDPGGRVALSSKGNTERDDGVDPIGTNPPSCIDGYSYDPTLDQCYPVDF